MNIGHYVKKIVYSFFNENVISVTQIVGKGSVNMVFLAETLDNKVIVRLNKGSHAFQDYQKESWCMMQASHIGIPGPTVHAIGKQDEYTYMIQSFIDGENGEDSSFDRTYIWNKLGQYVKRVGMIKVKGFGENLSNSHTGRFEAPIFEGFDGTWSGFLNYNINSLTMDDTLIDLGVLTWAKSKTVRRLFEKLQDYPFEFGLNHGDISLKNTIVPVDGKIHLLDWGSAGVALAPFWDIIQVLKCHITQNDPAQKEFVAFIEGLGLTRGEYTDMEPLIHSLMLLSAFDKLRWAIDRNPSVVKDFSQYASIVLQRVLRTL